MNDGCQIDNNQQDDKDNQKCHSQIKRDEEDDKDDSEQGRYKLLQHLISKSHIQLYFKIMFFETVYVGVRPTLLV